MSILGFNYSLSLWSNKIKKLLFILIAILFNLIFLLANECEIDLIDNYIGLLVNQKPIKFYLSSRLDERVTLDNDTQRTLKLDGKLTLSLGGRDFDNIKYDIGEKNSIGFGLFSKNSIKLDYKNNKLIVYEKDYTFDKKYQKYLVQDGLIAVSAKLTNFDYASDFVIDTSSFNNILNTNFIKANNLDKKLFMSAENYFDKIYYYEDIDIDIGAKYYNKTFIIGNECDTLGLNFFRDSTIYIDFVDQKIGIVNLNEEYEALLDIFSKNELNKVAEFLTQNDNFSDKNYFWGLYYKRVGRSDIAKDIILKEVADSYSPKAMSLYIDLLKEFPSTNDFVKLNETLNHNKKLISLIKSDPIYLFKDHNDLGVVEGSNGVVKYRVWKNKIFPTVSINGSICKNILYDTGWASLTISRSLAKKLKIKSVVKDALQVTSAFRNAKSYFWDYGVIDEITLGGIKLKNVVCTITKDEIFPGIKGVIGGELINQFNTIIDTQNRVLVFQKRKYKNKAYDNKDFNKTNLSLINQKPYVKVRLFDDKDYHFHFDTGNDTTFGTNSLFFEKPSNLKDIRHKIMGSFDLLGVNFYDVFKRVEVLKISEESIDKRDFYYRNQNGFYYPDIVKNWGNLGFDTIDGYVVYIDYDNMSFNLKNPSKWRSNQ